MTRRNDHYYRSYQQFRHRCMNKYSLPRQLFLSVLTLAPPACGGAAVLYWLLSSSVLLSSSAFISSSVGRSTALCTTASTATNIYTRKSFHCMTKDSNNNNNNNNNNPLSSMFGNVASSLLGGGNKNDLKFSADKVDTVLSSSSSSSSISVSAWNEIRKTLESLQTTDEEKEFRSNLKGGYGLEGSPLHTVRLYDADQSTTTSDAIRVVFYRDHASWCPYCQKVWITLEAKKIPYKVVKINMRCYGDKPASFFKLQPNGAIPVAIIDDQVYNQSNDILQILERKFTPEMPDGSHHMALSPPPTNKILQNQAQQLYRLERELFSAWMGWLTAGYGKQNFVDILRTVDDVLQRADGPFFLGSHGLSLVDIQFAPFLERMVASLLYFKGYKIRTASKERVTTADSYPGINAWFDAMEELPAYQVTKSDYYTHVWDLPPQLGGCRTDTSNKDIAASEIQIIQDKINGEHSSSDGTSSWDLPLQPDNDGLEPDWTFLTVTGNDEAAARREAVERISFNHEAIVKFACRGAGSKGFPNFGAPLSDPNAVPNEIYRNSVDACLKVVCSAMLASQQSKKDTATKGESDDDNDEQQQYTMLMDSLAKMIVAEGGPNFANGVIESVSYLRDRIGVPRDMRLPAARQLRAYLNWSIRFIRDASS